MPKLSWHVPENEPRLRFYLDVSKIKPPQDLEHMANSNWLVVVDNISELKVISFRQTKGGMVEPTCQLLNKFKNQGHPVEAIRFDNMEENKSLYSSYNSADWDLNLYF